MEARARGSEKRSSIRPFLFLLVFLGLGFATLMALRTGDPPALSLTSEADGIGRKSTVTVGVEAAGRGIGAVRVELRQGDRVWPLTDRVYHSRRPWALWGARDTSDSFEVEVGSEIQGKELREGEAVLRAVGSAPGTWLRAGTSNISERKFQVLLRPPVVGVLSNQHYPAQGGAELIVYTVGASAQTDGVQVRERFFPGHDVPGGPARQRFALFAVPFDLTDSSEILLVAEDAVGNRSERSFVDRLLTRPYETDRIEVSDRFMEKVVPEILANSPNVPNGEALIDTYLAINRDLRAENISELGALAEGSSEEFLWRGAFVPLPGAQVMSSFADRRTYYYSGEAVDQQDHLGFDLASVRKAEVPAANNGVVVLAKYLGIYGYAIVIDHGYGLMSLYGHLSSLAVEPGQRVDRGQTIGRTGETGLAAGDHLHFTMLLQGEAVSPVEWWDAKWIRDRLANKLEGVIPVGS